MRAGLAELTKIDADGTFVNLVRHDDGSIREVRSLNWDNYKDRRKVRNTQARGEIWAGCRSAFQELFGWVSQNFEEILAKTRSRRSSGMSGGSFGKGHAYAVQWMSSECHYLGTDIPPCPPGTGRLFHRSG